MNATKFAAAAATFAAIVNHASSDNGERALAYSQVLGAALYQNGQGWSDQDKAKFLAGVVETVLHNMPEIRYEFGLALQELEDKR